MALHWIALVSGAFAARYASRFPKSSRADIALLGNLRAVRQQLCDTGLPPATVHDLIARIIFIQFLFDRRDSEGRAALSPELLRAWHDEPVEAPLRLSAVYTSLPDVLANPDDAYRLFERLNRHFNGDLFAAGAEQGWQAERALISAAIGNPLGLLGEFVRGDLEIEPGQFSIWPLYAFDVIPLEFISSIYEEFVAKDPGVVYTPPSLADFVLDAVLPWDGEAWDIRVLDPACGSGIFLVKAYQRLIHRWKRAHGQLPDAAVLTLLLRENLVGVDPQRDATRIAAFSLYLALCDEVEPREVWDQIELPPLCGSRLIEADFFREDVPGIRTGADAGTFDLVVGNAPWASGSLTRSPAAKAWARDPAHPWPTFEKSVGPLFLAKAAALTKPDGRVSLIQPASLLVGENASAFRERLFTTYDVVEVVNFAPVRRVLFEGSNAPACLITLCPVPPTEEPIAYLCPKPTSAEAGAFRLVLDPHDVAWVTKTEAALERVVWTALCWGGRRELDVLRRLRAEGTTIAALKKAKVLQARNGIVWGKSQRKELRELAGRSELAGSALPSVDGVFLDAAAVEPVHTTWIHKKDSSELKPFAAPQILLRRSWDAKTGRYQAALVPQQELPNGVVCSQSFVSVHAKDGDAKLLRALFATFTSPVSVFYQLMTSQRVGSERPNLSPEDVFLQPFAARRTPSNTVLLQPQARDAFVYHTFGLNALERIVVEDAAAITMPDLHRGRKGPGNHPTRNCSDGRYAAAAGADPLDVYADAVLTVLATGFSVRSPSAYVYDTLADLGIRVVVFQLEGPAPGRITHRPADTAYVLDALRAWSAAQQSDSPLPRVARLYVSERVGSRYVPLVVMVKPDRLRYWTRAIGLRDADDIVADAVAWARAQQARSGQVGSQPTIATAAAVGE
jgi:hypothetical protein